MDSLRDIAAMSELSHTHVKRLTASTAPLSPADFDVVRINADGAASIGYEPSDAGRIAVQWRGEWHGWADSLDHATRIIAEATGVPVRLKPAYSPGTDGRWEPEDA